MRGLSRSFQITSILPGFAVLENVALAVQARDGSSLRFFGRAADEAALNIPAMAALEQTGIADRAHLPAGELSHGEKRALELAIALAMKPTLLLLDEPMAGIGREETERLVALLLSLKGQFTMILVEHDMAAVFALADRISVLIRGRVLTTGSPQQVRDRSAGRRRLSRRADGVNRASGRNASGRLRRRPGIVRRELHRRRGRNGDAPWPQRHGQDHDDLDHHGAVARRPADGSCSTTRSSTACRLIASPRPASASCPKAARSFRRSASRRT